MAKFLGILAVVMAFVSAPSASAQTFLTVPGNYTFSGTSIHVQKGSGPVLSCAVDMDIRNDGFNVYVDQVSLTGSFGLCGSITRFSSGPNLISNWGSGLFSSNVYIYTQSPLGDCAGLMWLTFYQSGSVEELYFGNGGPAIIPQAFANGDCNISGTVSWP